MEDNFKMLAKTFYGFEEILANELRVLGAQGVEIGNRSVSFVGDKGLMYKANLSLRTAVKILKPIHTATVRTPEELYQVFYDFDWDDYLTVNSSFAIDSVVFGPHFTHSQFVSQKAKDGIVDRFRNIAGKRPDVDLRNPDLRINIHIQNDLCTISLDSSGPSLHHRGYRTATNAAPLNEVLAAGIIQLSGWKGTVDFLDPMCGSGTIAIEAAMIVAQIPANINRTFFAFQKWFNWDADLFERICNAQLKKIIEPTIEIKGSDKSPAVVAKAIQNVKNAGLSDFITIEKADFFQIRKQNNLPLHLLTNPPYGERLRGDMTSVYKNIGDTLKRYFADADAWVITSNLEAMKFIGLRPSRKVKLFNGKLESRLLYFPVYTGTKRVHKMKS